MNFRICLDLSHFFKDHRKKARVFIKEDIVSIKMLRKKIRRIFLIGKCYLMCDNQFLPDEESVHILRDDEVVRVMPVELYEEPLWFPTPSRETTLNCSGLEAHSEMEKKVSLSPKRKKKKHKRSLEQEETVESMKKAKRAEQEDTAIKGLDNIKSILPKIQTHIKSCNEDGRLNGVRLSREITVPLKPAYSMPTPITKQYLAEKKINIVTILPVVKATPSRRSIPENHVKSLVSSFEEDASPSITVYENKLLPRDDAPVKPLEEVKNTFFSTETKKMSGLGTFLETLKSDNGSMSDTSLASSTVKRKRVRTRKRKSRGNAVRAASPLLPPELPAPLKCAANPSIHIKFEEESPSVVISPSAISNHSEPTSVTEATLEVNTIYSFNDEEPVLETKSVVSETNCEAQDFRPAPGDVLAFKVLKISEQFTPEVSEYIEGRVTAFDSTTQMVSLDILKGGEQLATPPGKLSFIPEDGVNPVVVTHECFCLNDLYQVKLL